jgi:hypothetical protein
MVESCTDMWQLVGVWYSATWPSHGLPRGTHILVEGFWKILFGSTRFETVTSGLGEMTWQGWVGHPALTLDLNNYWCRL